MKRDFITIRFPVNQCTLEALAHRYGQKKATLRDAKSWAASTLQSTMEQVIHELEEAEAKKAES